MLFKVFDMMGINLEELNDSMMTQPTLYIRSPLNWDLTNELI